MKRVAKEGGVKVKQADVFYHSEGACWLARNEEKLTGIDDPVMAAIKDAKIKPNSVLEIGCSNGWRLKLLEKKYKCATTGVEPAAIGTGNILRGTADNLPIKHLTFDVVIYGWCLYLCDREDLFKIAAEGDRVLQEDGYLIVYDFFSNKPYQRAYKHHPGIFSYKMDHSLIWLANPAYRLMQRTMIDDETAITILHKDTAHGWPLND